MVAIGAPLPPVPHQELPRPARGAADPPAAGRAGVAVTTVLPGFSSSTLLVPQTPVVLPEAPARKMVVRGGARLKGEIATNGAKNAATKMMASALLTREPVVLENVPNIEAIRTQAELLRALGATVEFDAAAHRLTVVADRLASCTIVPELAEKERSAFVLVGPLLARHGTVETPKPGGCKIGERPVDVAMRGFRLMGAEVVHENGEYLLQTTGLRGARIYLDYPSHTGTENLMMAACLANGTTVILNASCEPEVVALAEHLTRMGAMIRGAGTSKIEVVGVPVLRGARTWVMPDRIEAGSFAIAAAATGGDLVIRRVVSEHLEPLTYKLKDDAMLVRRTKPLSAVEVQALPYPGFPTDLQTPMCVLLTQAQGTSIIHERVFPDRFRYVEELRALGARIDTDREESSVVNATKVYVHGPAALRGARVRALDLRSGMALIIAGLVAEGSTEIADFHHADRGYEDLSARLRAIGADLSEI
jgi:UDP-N-acetylglucosamine 1-carboxyvinyltransferase